MSSNVIDFPVRSDPEPWRSIQDVAAYYGFTTKWVYYRMKDGMPHRRVSGRLRFRLSETEAWLKDREGSS